MQQKNNSVSQEVSEEKFLEVEATKNRLEELYQESQKDIIDLQEKLESTELQYIELRNQKEKSKNYEDKNITETPSKYHYDLLKMEHDNTLDALKDREKLGMMDFCLKNIRTSNDAKKCIRARKITK